MKEGDIVVIKDTEIGIALDDSISAFTTVRNLCTDNLEVYHDTDLTVLNLHPDELKRELDQLNKAEVELVHIENKVKDLKADVEFQVKHILKNYHRKPTLFEKSKQLLRKIRGE